MGAQGHRAGGPEIPPGPRHAAKPAAARGRRVRHYPGVALLGSESDGPAELEDGLDLDLDDDGVRLSPERGGFSWAPPWAAVSVLSVADDRRLPDGRRGLVVTVATLDHGDRVVAVPARRPWAEAARIRAIARRRRVDPDRPDRRAPVVVVVPVVAAAAALVTWLLLAAGHVVSR